MATRTPRNSQRRSLRAIYSPRLHAAAETGSLLRLAIADYRSSNMENVNNLENRPLLHIRLRSINTRRLEKSEQRTDCTISLCLSPRESVRMSTRMHASKQEARRTGGKTETQRNC